MSRYDYSSHKSPAHACTWTSSLENASVQREASSLDQNKLHVYINNADVMNVMALFYADWNKFVYRKHVGDSCCTLYPLTS